MMRRTLHQDRVADSFVPEHAPLPRRSRAGRPVDLGRIHSRDLARPHKVYDKGRLQIDFDAYEVSIDGEKVHLFLREYEILCFLVRSPNRVFSREQLLDLIWGRDTRIDPRTVDVHVRRLRRRIERDDAHPELVVTIRGVGYKFDERALMGVTRPPARVGDSGR